MIRRVGVLHHRFNVRVARVCRRYEVNLIFYFAQVELNRSSVRRSFDIIVVLSTVLKRLLLDVRVRHRLICIEPSNFEITKFLCETELLLI